MWRLPEPNMVRPATARGRIEISPLYAACRRSIPVRTEASRSRGREHKPANGSAQGRSAAPASDSAGGMAIVWKLEGSDAIRTVEIALGITDHAFTAVTSILKGELKEGDQVVTRSVSSKAMAPTGQGIRR